MVSPTVYSVLAGGVSAISTLISGSLYVVDVVVVVTVFRSMISTVPITPVT